MTLRSTPLTRTTEVAPSSRRPAPPAEEPPVTLVIQSDAAAAGVMRAVKASDSDGGVGAKAGAKRGLGTLSTLGVANGHGGGGSRHGREAKRGDASGESAEVECSRGGIGGVGQGVDRMET